MSATHDGRLGAQLEADFEDSAVLSDAAETSDAVVAEPIPEVVASLPEVPVAALPDIVFVINDDGVILECCGGDAKDLAFPRRRLIGKRMYRCPFGDVGPQFATAIDLARTCRKPITIEYTLPCDNGLAHFEARLARSSDGRFLALVRNVTDRVEARLASRRTQYDCRELFESAPAAIMLLDPATGNILECNRRADLLYQRPHEALVESSLLDLFVDLTHLPDLRSIADSDTVERVESWHRLPDDRVILIEMMLSGVQVQGQTLVLSVNREFEARQPERPDERNSLSMLKATFDATADGILVVDPEGNFVTCNRLFADMWRIPMDLLQPGREPEAVKIALAQLKEPTTLVEEIIEMHMSGKARASKVVEFLDGRFFECVSMPQLIAGERAGRVWSFRDITDRMRAEERIRHHAYHDALTGLPNRTLFQDRLSQVLGQSQRAGHNTALLLIDLDRFKTINDTLGHAAGDQLLIEVAKRLKSRKREGDTISRLGGDEFVFLVSNLRHKEDVAVVAEQILDVLKPPIHIAEHDLHVSASIGIALFPEDGDKGVTLLKKADVALYRAKELGRNNYQIYEPKLSQRAIERLVMEKDLRQAIHNQEFVLYYQPQFELKTGRLRGVEALIRWVQGDAVIPPGKFIPIAEECGLVVPLGRWVLEESARQCAEFNRHSPDPLRICVNISALQIQRPDFANEVSQIVQEAGLPLKQLVVELTESALMQNPEQGSWAMAQLEQMGIGIAMDDFGTGHSSLTHLSHLPISMIKIDRSFVINCATRKTDALILSAIIRMGHALGLKVLAEGVETEAQARVLREQGCDEVQGYLFGRPISAEALIELIKSQP